MFRMIFFFRTVRLYVLSEEDQHSSSALSDGSYLLLIIEIVRSMIKEQRQAVNKTNFISATSEENNLSPTPVLLVQLGQVVLVFVCLVGGYRTYGSSFRFAVAKPCRVGGTRASVALFSLTQVSQNPLSCALLKEKLKSHQALLLICLSFLHFYSSDRKKKRANSV